MLFIITGNLFAQEKDPIIENRVKEATKILNLNFWDINF